MSMSGFVDDPKHESMHMTSQKAHTYLVTEK